MVYCEFSHHYLETFREFKSGAWVWGTYLDRDVNVETLTLLLRLKSGAVENQEHRVLKKKFYSKIAVVYPIKVLRIVSADNGPNE